MHSASHNMFAQAPQADIQRSSFDRSHGLKTTMNAGWLVPFFLDEVLPGDTHNLNATIFARMATPLRPIMDNLYFETQFFFVPFRLLWSNFQKQMGEQDNPGDSVSFLTPITTAPVGGYVQPANWLTPTNAELSGALADYMGLPTQVAGYTHTTYAQRAYNLIYNQCYRDQNLQTSRPVPMGDGPDNYLDFRLMRRGKRHDYFTGALPFPQKGPTINLPLGTQAPIRGLGVVGSIATGSGTSARETTPLTSPRTFAFSTTALTAEIDSATGATARPLIYADLTAATAATINELRQAFQIQKLYERDARGGTRYVEIIYSHYGVVSPDARLNRPEYLGGGSTNISVTPVAQTSAASSQPTPQGNLAAIGTMLTAGNDNHGFIKSFTEHGIILGICSVRAEMTYQQGLHKMFKRRTKLDYYWPVLACLGEQIITNGEIYCQGTATDDLAFGYQERWAEYRYKPSYITGRMRSNFGTSLHSWHLAQNFGTLPVLNDSFIVENPPVDRVVAVTTEPQFLLDCWFKYNSVRPMPTHSVPGMIDHF